MLIVCGSFPPDIGGPATYVPMLARDLITQGHEATVVTLSDDLDHDDGSYPYCVERIPRQAKKPFRWLLTVRSILRLGRRADILFVSGLPTEAAVVNWWLRKPLIEKVVGDFAWERARNRGWVQDEFEEFQLRRHSLRVEAMKALRAWRTRRSTKVIVPSEYLARWVANWGIPEHKIVVIHNGVELLTGIEPIKIPLKTPVKIVAVGRLVSWKRVDKLIQAIARLDGVGLIVVGDGPEREHLENQVQALGLAERVYFAGRRSRSNTLALMSGSDIFVLNSSYEGLPHVVLEAMALRLPIVATAAGGTPELIEDGRTGLLVNFSDRDLVRTLERLADDRHLRKSLGKQAQEAVRDKFSIHSLVARVEEVLIGEAADNFPSAKNDREWVRCNLCGSPCHQRLFTKRSWRIVRCTNCDLVFVNPRPSLRTLPSLYGDHPKSSKLRSNESIWRNTEKYVNRPQEYLDIILRRKNAGRILDVGCNEGSFLQRASAHGFDVMGIEISQAAVKVATEEFGIREAEIICGAFESVILEPEQFDVITFWDVLEHLPDPSAALRKSRNLLSDDGILVVRCPNIDGLVPRASYYAIAKAFGRWPHPSPPKHLYEFSETTLRALLLKTGFQTIEILASEIPPSCFSGGRRMVELGLRLSYLIARLMRRPNSMVLVARKM